MNANTQSNNPPSQDIFFSFIRRAPELLRESRSFLTPKILGNATRVLENADRVFVVGSGSSIPAALYFSLSMNSSGRRPVQFISTSELVSYRLGPNDAVFLISQGFDRADALIVAKTTQEAGARFVLLTGADVKDVADVVLRFVPKPLDERLFCRPAGVITSYAIVAELAARMSGNIFSEELCLDAISDSVVEGEIFKESIDTVGASIFESDVTIVLSSGLMMPSAQNVALALREGASKISNCFEIEYFGHGQYAPYLNHVARGGKASFILVSSDSDLVSRRSAERISPLLRSSGATLTTWTSPKDPIYANLSVLAAGSRLVGSIIRRSGYDMNTPHGKESNRGFHEVAANFYCSEGENESSSRIYNT